MPKVNGRRSNRTRRERFHDEIYFRKEDVKLGTKIRSAGRLDAGQVWRVTKIVTTKVRPNGVTHRVEVDAVERIYDVLTLQSGKETRSVLFSTLCYSAKWRL